jgi:hypothetical protein
MLMALSELPMPMIVLDSVPVPVKINPGTTKVIPVYASIFTFAIISLDADVPQYNVKMLSALDVFVAYNHTSSMFVLFDPVACMVLPGNADSPIKIALPLELFDSGNLE